ncbi:MAG: primosomal protein N' [Burkholderiales bacterium]
MSLVRVALDVPLARLFDYRCDDRDAAVGARVLVPFGRQKLVGIVVARPQHSEVPEAKLRRVSALLDETPLLLAADLRLLEFAAEYYAHPLGSVAMATLPAALRRVRQRDLPPPAWTLTAAGRAAAVDVLPPRARAQRNLLTLLQQQTVIDHAAIAAAGTATRKALKDFIGREWVRPDSRGDIPAAATPPTATVPPQLTPEQAAATAEIMAALGTYQTLLLWGITGSGKTEVYLHAMAAALARDEQVLLLVPEIALTPQLEQLVVARFPGVPVATLHSGLADGERARRWQAARNGKARIVLGTRLSVFTPLPKLGLIIVDEEHDTSFKQGEGFRYSARDLAVVRARQASIPVLLGSATPALETWRNATDRRYRLLKLTRHVQGALPDIACVDLQHQPQVDGLAAPLIAAIGACVARGEQSLIFINRRGYAPVLMCGSCGWISDCRRCSARLVVHLRERVLRCHHCGHERPVPVACPQCGDADLAPVGQGTQRIEAALAGQFPDARIMRIDRDTTRRKDAWQTMRGRIHDREVDILVGTQILAKGHDFPHLSLVGVINADSMLYSSDFRAAERLYALLTQVAGRAGRGARPGRVLVQTRFPDHPLFTALRSQDFEAFARIQLAERRQAGFPPYVHQALLRAEARDLATALRFLEEAAHAAHGLASEITIFDPVPAQMMRRAGRERAQLLVQATSRARLRGFLKDWHPLLAGSASTASRWSLDVDPLEF